MIWHLKDLIESANSNTTEINGKWVPARPLNWKHDGLLNRIKAAIKVLKGSVDVVIWPEKQ